jgi:Golgi phosphoprotein 3 (GPP34)
VDNLGDDLVLLSLNPGTGRVRTSQKIGYGLMGSELVRLVAADRIGISGGRLVCHSSTPTGDAELDAALASISQAGRPPRVQRWVGHPRRGIASAYLDRLTAAGVIRKERALTTRWRIADAGRLAEAQARVDAIARSAGPVDLTQAALGGLAHAIGLDAALYPGWGNRGLRRRSKDIASGGATAADPAVQAAVTAATQAAVQAATETAVHAEVQAAVDASVSAAHSASAAGHGGHGGH